jgi:hypothetical protein
MIKLQAASRLQAAKQPTWDSHKYPLYSIVTYKDHKGREQSGKVMSQVFYGPDEEPAYRILDSDGVVLESDVTGRVPRK